MRSSSGQRGTKMLGALSDSCNHPSLSIEAIATNMHSLAFTNFLPIRKGARIPLREPPQLPQCSPMTTRRPRAAQNTHSCNTTPPQQQPTSASRRTFLLAIGTSLILPLPTRSETRLPKSGEMHAELSELASKIPGAGMPDVYFPVFFEGEWLVTRELYAVETPFPAEAPSHAALGKRAVSRARDRIGTRQSYVVRFVTHRGHIIEDRVANERAEWAALFPHQRISAAGDRDNPNVLTVSRSPLASPTPITREVKVTKRAFVDSPQGYGTFVASEYARVVDLEDEGGLAGFGRPPSIYGRRKIARYRVSSVNDDFQPDGMDRIVVEYLYAPGAADSRAAVVYKYRDFLNRKNDVIATYQR